MKCFKGYIKKEFIEGIRTKKFLILAAGVFFFSLSDPVLLKLLPEILKNQMQGIDLSTLIELSQKAAMESYTKNLFQISTLIIVLSLMGIMCNELKDKTLTIPVSMGCTIKGVISGKLVVYGLYLIIINVVGMIIAYCYSGMIFGFTHGSFLAAIISGFIYGIFFILVLSLLFLFSSFFKKSFAAAIATLVLTYFMSFLKFSQRVWDISPGKLLEEANYFRVFSSKEMLVPLIFTIFLIVLSNVIAVIKFKKVEFV